jgi:predicted ATPase
MPDGITMTKVLREDAASRLYQGVRQQDGARVLVKVIRADSPVSREVERLRTEYEVECRLEGPWVPRPLGLEALPGQLRLICEGFDGDLLSSYARPLQIEPCLDLALTLTTALAELHRQDVVHKDLNPANILVDARTGAVKILGLGIAGRLSQVPTAPARPSLVEGSPAYMSPEQTGHMNRGVDHRSDLYSFGVILYQLLTGRLPFQAADPLEWAHCHVARTPRPPAEIAPSIPAGLSAVVLKLLAKQAEDRYQSAEGLLADLVHCREELTARGTVAPFPLGVRDVCDQFLISPRLYGRERELAALADSFDRVLATGTTELLLVSGYSGIGKSSLVQELRRPVARARGYFVSGKYDQYQRDVPYSTLVQACQELIRQILSESEERVQAWKAALQEALGANAGLIVDLVPQLGLLIGPQPPVPTLPPSEAQQRFQLVVGRFLAVFARPQHPLVLFLDDLQWLDPASLRLMAYLLGLPDRGALLLVGAYRDNEVGPSHPLTGALEEIRRGGVRLQELLLGPLPPVSLRQFVADTLRRPAEDAALLAQLVHDKTEGNPFFAIHFLTTLHQEGLLPYDARTGSWQWDLDAIRGQSFTDNVVDLMLGKLRRLTTPAQKALTQAACIGSTADARTLALLTDQTEDELHMILQEALHQGLLSLADGRYTFLHDRVQEAAYALLEPEQRPAQHLRTGRILLAHTPPDRLTDNIFEIAGQLNHATSLITSAAERERLAELNLIAGRRAKAGTAFASALTYLTAGTALLSPTAWDSAYELTFALHVERAECESLVRNRSCAEELLALTLTRARSVLDRAWAYRLRVRLLQLSEEWQEALNTALEALGLFAVSLPDDDDAIVAATDAEIRLISDNLRGRRIADLADIPLSGDPEVRTLIGLLEEALPVAYGAHALLFPLLSSRSVNIFLQRGHAEESAFIYTCHAMALAGMRRDIPAARQFSELAVQLNERLPSAAAWRGKVLFHHSLITSWSRHFAATLPILDQSFDACLDCGDLFYGNYVTYQMILAHFENADRLDDVVALAHRLADFARHSKHDLVYKVDRLLEQFALALQGRTRSLTDFSDADFDEAGCAAAVARASFGVGVVFHYVNKQVAFFLAGRFDEALQWADDIAPALVQAASFPVEAMYHFYRALTLTALAAQASGERREVLLRQLQEPLEMMTFWAGHCPENFANREALIRAELAGIEARDTDAMRLYDQAITSARENGFIHQEGLAFELASRFYRSKGIGRIADVYLGEARDRYASWGAEGKVRELDRQHPALVETRFPAPEGVFSARTEQLDLLSVVKASQAISHEILLPQLQETLLRLALEHAGAQHGALLLVDGERLAVHARAETEGDQTRVDIVPGLPASATELPVTLLNYVLRSGETLVLADAAADPRYSTDEYVTHHRARSVIGLPIIRQGKLTGILYLENNLVSGAFIPSKLAVLELLAAQAAISLETARLYTNLQELNTQLQEENAERCRAEGEVRKLNRELEERVLERTAQLKATNKELETFAYSVSHDLRAPVRAIHGFAEILVEDHAHLSDDESLQLLTKVLRSSERMGQLIDDLLTFSRMSRQGLSLRSVDLGALVQDVLRDLEPEVCGRDIHWRIARLPVVLGDQAMLRVALVNLISNAVKFTRTRAVAEIEIGLADDPHEWVLFVRDNGVGFDPRHADRIFEVFQRLHGVGEFEGTGIGLANVRRVIERHEGRTWAEGGVDQGATFYFSLLRCPGQPGRDVDLGQFRAGILDTTAAASTSPG